MRRQVGPGLAKLAVAGLAALTALTSGESAARPPVAAVQRDLDQLIPPLMRDYGVRGVGVALIAKGKIASKRYYGYADAEKGIRLSDQALFQPASVAKSVTAAGVLRLVQDERIGLDDPLFSRVAGWRPPASQYPLDQVTIRRVLSHTSGLSRWTTGIWTVNDKLPSLTAALSGDNPEHEPTLLIAQPGSKYSYSGAGYSLLQLLIEQTSGRPFQDYMLQRIFRPLGLRHSRIGWPATGLPGEIKTYDEFGTALANYRTVELGAGGWVTNLPDFAKYAASFSRVNWGKGPLSARTVQLMMTPVPAGKVDDSTTMGLGLFIETAPDGRKLVGHTGGNPGVGALFSIDPETGSGIAILLNRSWANQIYNPIACEWRNATRRPGFASEACPRNPTGIIMTTVANSGLAAGKERFDALYAAAPQELSESRMSWMAERFYFSGRGAEAQAVVRWHPKFPRSAELHEILGEILNASGDPAGARAAWTESLRLHPGRDGIEQKLKELDKPRQQTGPF